MIINRTFTRNLFLFSFISLRSLFPLSILATILMSKVHLLICACVCERCSCRHNMWPCATVSFWSVLPVPTFLRVTHAGVRINSTALINYAVFLFRSSFCSAHLCPCSGNSDCLQLLRANILTRRHSTGHRFCWNDTRRLRRSYKGETYSDKYHLNGPGKAVLTCQPRMVHTSRS